MAEHTLSGAHRGQKGPHEALIPVFDTHCDSLQRDLDLGHDLGTSTRGHLDLVRGREGGLAAVVLVCWCDPLHLEPGQLGARERTKHLLGRGHQLLGRHPDQVRWVGNHQHLTEAREAGQIGALFGIEGGHSIEGSLENLEWFFERGVRVMTLVWNNHLDWIRSCRDGAGPNIPAGLSSFGREVVQTMNRLGMLVDLSHAGEQSFYDALEVSSAPVLVSHSGCYALHDHPRNLRDAQMKVLAQNRGVLGIVFCTPFLDAQARATESRLRETKEYQSISGFNPTDTFLQQAEWLQSQVKPLPLDRVLDHICHGVDVAGIDHVGIGSDFDGIECTPDQLSSAACYQALAVGLAARGLNRADITKILFSNSQRVLAEATGPGTRASGAPLQALECPKVS